MKLHILGNPRVPSGLKNRIDPFSVFVYKYIKHLGSKYEMIHYGLPGAEVDCEHVDIDVPLLPNRNEHNRNLNRAISPEISKRKSKDDMIVCFFGAENSEATFAHQDLKIVEPSIGYRTNAVFAPFRAFTSYAHMHMFYGERGMLMNPSWTDAVIPNPFTVSEFEYKQDKQDYFLYLGRVCKEKGVDLAIQATEKLGAKLIIAGPGDLISMGYDKIPDHVECVGTVDADARKDLLANAKCLLGLTYYVEPFGNMVIEANLSGTPCITTDWGAFPETVIDGVTGYRVRDFNTLVEAMDQVAHIEPWECRRNGLRYSDEIIHARHDEWLQKIIKNDFYA